MKERERKLRRITAVVPEDFHSLIKSTAAKRGMTIRQYLLQALWEKLKAEDVVS